MREIALHLLDLARNCLDADATEVELTIIEDQAADRLFIELRDNGRGMDAETLAQASDPFFTTRTTRRWGLGLSLFETTVERCEGRFAVESEPGRGTTVRAEMQLRHWDRPPLGGMGGVIQCLACEADRVALTYRHTVRRRDGGEETFELRTAELQEELGPVRLTSPGVLHWLGAYVGERIGEIGSEA